MNRIAVFSLLALTVAGCSSVDNKHAVGGFTYAKTPEAKKIIIPEGMDVPKQHADFQVSDDINHNGPIGEYLDVRAPSLVLPVAASSRVIANSEDAIVWFDKILEDRDLLPFIELALTNELISSNVGLNRVEGETGIFESDWFNSESESGWIFKSIDSSESIRYRYQLIAKPHGRSVSLQVSLIDYMKTDQKGGGKSINPIDKQRAEMAMVNEIIGQVDYLYRLEEKEIRTLRANKKMVAIGKNPVDQAAYIIEMEMEYLWSNLPVFFEKYGFVITDLNETKKIYYVDFFRPESGIWDKLWGENTPDVDLVDAKYQFVLTKINNQTALTIYDVNGKVLPVETLNRLFDVMEPGLSFRDVY
jgi:outer membrane protein assembly factor BamC